MNKVRISSSSLAAAVLALIFFGALMAAGSQSSTHKREIFAQKLVESTHAKYPETDEIGIATISKRGCYGIASTDPSDVGERCEAEDLKPIRTRQPYVEHEGGGFDVSLPLYDSGGKLVGSVGIGFKRSAGQSRAEVTRKAKQIAGNMAKQIQSKAALFSQGQ
jgi:hypothetical protein